MSSIAHACSSAIHTTQSWMDRVNDESKIRVNFDAVFIHHLKKNLHPGYLWSALSRIKGRNLVSVVTAGQIVKLEFIDEDSMLIKELNFEMKRHLPSYRNQQMRIISSQPEELINLSAIINFKF